MSMQPIRKARMAGRGAIKSIGPLLLGLAVCAGAVAQTDISTVPLHTYSAPSSTDVKPNVLFVLDDSGSMDWNYMPDWANDSSPPDYLFKNSAFNGVAYNPAVRYAPPVSFREDGSLDTAAYPSMTGTSSATGADPGRSLPNWKHVQDDGYGVQNRTSTWSGWKWSSSDLEGSAYSYIIIPGEYCNSASMTSCIAATAPTGNYTVPAYLRWCSDTALTKCRASWGTVNSTNYTKRRIPSPRTATITISGSSSTTVSGIAVGGAQIMAASASSGSRGSASTLASDIADEINACSNGRTGKCTVAGYSATSYGSEVTVYAPGVLSETPTVTRDSGSMSFAVSAFKQGPVPGENLRMTITPGVDSYSYPGSNAKAPGRTDCAGATCTYVEEMTNYANWWAYYRTRMQMMKTAASNAISKIDTESDLANNVSRFRLGFLSINNNTNSDFLNLGEFKTAHKHHWYGKLQNAIPLSGTPLRAALSTAGHLYAGKLNGKTLNGSVVIDPLQYSCQQNYTILSSDGYWNGNAGYQLNGSAVGNQDAGLARPMYDGATAKVETRTSTLMQQTVTIQRQIRTSQLQKRTRRNNGSWTNWSNASSCTPNSSTECRYNNWSGWSNTNACTPVERWQSTPYTSAVECRSQAGKPGTAVSVSQCTASDTNICTYSGWTSWSTVGSCTAVPQSTGPKYTVATARECQTVSSGGTSNTLADVAAYYYDTDLRDSAEDKGTGTCTGPVVAPSTTANNLCTNNVPANGLDVATTQHMTTFTLGLGAQGQMVYSPTHWTDTSGDFFDVKMGSTANPATGVCSWQGSGLCNWPTPSADSIANIDDLWHAAVNGRGAYFSATDPASLSKGLTDTLSIIVNTPRPGTAAAAASSNPNITSSDNYIFSSSYKSVDWYGELIRQQIDNSGALSEPQWSAMRLLDCATTPWTAGTSYAAGSNFSHGGVCYTVTDAYSSGTQFGAGDLANAAVVAGAPVTRKIYTKGTSGMISFEWANLSTTQKAYFTKPAIAARTDGNGGLTQFCETGGTCLPADRQNNTTVASGGAAGEALVNFLRGDRANEGTYYRTRAHVLGDIVSSEARYVKAPLFRYNDAGYSDYRAAKANRAGMVYVGANDGMLHAFNAENGQEAWAYIPSMVLPEIYRLADKEYAGKHQFFVDNSPEVGDICPNAPASACTGAQWKTILVGGLNRGGKGYFALDITDPANPVLLWEFTDATLGYTYGNPRITKLKDGTWVVMFASGHNNADGKGRLYVLNAFSGQKIRTIETNTGSASAPGGLARISAHAREPMTNNTTTAVYGGDLLGNLWRFDVNGDIGASGYDAHRLATFKDADGKPQSVTAKPLEATIKGKPVVYVGTGRFLGTSDVMNTGIQTFYAVRDPLDATSYFDNPRDAGNKFVAQTISAGTCPEGAELSVCSPGQLVRTSSSNAVDWSVANGFYVDFLVPGERSATDPTLGLGTLLFTTITPQASSANVCGDDSGSTSASFVYALDYLTGGAVVGAKDVVGMSLGNGMVTRPIMVAQADGTVRALIRASMGAGGGIDLGTTLVRTPPIRPVSSGAVRRVSWRELTEK